MASAIVSHVRNSIHATEVLESEKRLQTSTVTRLNSQLRMILSVLRIPEESLNSIDPAHKMTANDRKVISLKS